jgi:hypothetical protein
MMSLQPNVIDPSKLRFRFGTVGSKLLGEPGDTLGPSRRTNHQHAPIEAGARTPIEDQNRHLAASPKAGRREPKVRDKLRRSSLLPGLSAAKKASIERPPGTGRQGRLA